MTAVPAEVRRAAQLRGRAILWKFRPGLPRRQAWPEHRTTGPARLQPREGQPREGQSEWARPLRVRARLREARQRADGAGGGRASVPRAPPALPRSEWP